MTNDSQLPSPLEGVHAARIARLQEQLAAQAQPKTKEWWEKHLKHSIPFRGVKMAAIRAQLHAWVESEGLRSELTAGQQKSLALALLRQTYAEDKLAGILYLQEVLLPAGAVDWREDVPRFAPLFSQGYIHGLSRPISTISRARRCGLRQPSFPLKSGPVSPSYTSNRCCATNVAIEQE